MKMGHLKSVLIIATTLLMLGIGFNNCSGVQFSAGGSSSSLGSSGDSDPSNYDPLDTIPMDPVDPPPSQSYLKFSYEIPTIPQAVDILFVIDNSRSMTVELANLGGRFPQFAAALSGKDWQACFVTTDWENEKGQLRKWRGADYVLSPAVPSFAHIFKDTLDHITDEVAPMSFYEHGIYSAFEAFNRAFTADAKNCFRENTAKAVLIISDEDELGEGWARPTSETPQYGNKPENLIAKAKEKFGSAVHFTAHAVAIRPGDQVCLDEQRTESGSYDKSFGYEAIRYNELVQSTGGVFISVCQEDYSDSLKEIGEKVLKSVSEVEVPCARETIVKNINIENKVHASRAYQVSKNKITFVPALVSGEKIEVIYQCVE